MIVTIRAIYISRVDTMATKRPFSSAANNEKKKAKGKAYCNFKASWKKQDFTVTVRGEAGESECTKTVVISGSVLSADEGADVVKCTVCGVTFSVRHGG